MILISPEDYDLPEMWGSTSWVWRKWRLALEVSLTCCSCWSWRAEFAGHSPGCRKTPPPHGPTLGKVEKDKFSFMYILRTNTLTMVFDICIQDPFGLMMMWYNNCIGAWIWASLRKEYLIFTSKWIKILHKMYKESLHVRKCQWPLELRCKVN